MKFVKALSVSALALCAITSAFAGNSSSAGTTAKADVASYGPAIHNAAENVTSAQSDVTTAQSNVTKACENVASAVDMNQKIKVGGTEVTLGSAVQAVAKHCSNNKGDPICSNALADIKTLHSPKPKGC